MDKVLHRFPWAPHSSGSNAPQAAGVPRAAIGPNNVYEYSKKFDYLAQYGVFHVVTDEKKAQLFRKGMSAQLQDCLILFCDLM
jgi:hypothetical protein